MQIAATPRSLTDPGQPPTPEKTLTRWRQFLGTIACGTVLQDAMMKHYMTRADIEACVRSSHEERSAWNDARLAALKRGWTVMQFEDIFEKIAGGEKINEAVEAVKPGASQTNNRQEFNRIVISDSVLNEQYMAALRSRALIVSDEILEIADDDSNDVIHNDKGPAPNQAAVNRSKLRVETRRALMTSWFPKLFGEAKNQTQVNVQVNYAEKLEEARTRATKRSSESALTRDVIEAAFRDVAVEDEFAWLDEKPKPLDTTWLEA